MRDTNARVIAAVLVLIFVSYILIVGNQVLALIGSGSAAAVFAGSVMVLLPVAGLVAVWRELRFKARVQHMAKTLESQGGPVGEVPSTDHEAANPNDWRSWYGLAATYDAEGDHKKARAAMRHALSLFQ